MAILGSQPSSWSTWQYYAVNEPNQVCTELYTMPEDGWVTSVSFYADSYSGTTTFSWVLWDENGNIIANSGSIGLGAGSASVGGQAWHTEACGLLLKSGQKLSIGWWREESGSMLYSLASGSNGYYGSNEPASPSSLGTLTGIGGTIGAYITYTAVSPPSATTGSAASITTTSAVLNGSVNDNGYAAAGAGSTNCDFNISTSSTGSPSTPVGATPSTFTGTASPTATVTGLSAGTTYYFQVAAWNAEGTAYGSWVPFTTAVPPPSATTGSATSITTTSAVLNGSANDNGYAAAGFGSTDYAFYIAPSPTSAATLVSSGTFTGSPDLSASAGSLAPATTYYFQLQVSNADGSGSGAWVSFATPAAYTAPSPPTLDSPANSSYADVSAGLDFTATYNSTDGTAQNAYAMRIKTSGGTYSYFDASSNTLQSTIVWDTADVGVGGSWSWNLPATLISNGNTYNWSAASQESGANLQGSFAADFVLNAEAGPALTVTAPTGTIVDATPSITWTETLASGAVQTYYEAILEAGTFSTSPGSGTQVWASGLVASAALSVQAVTNLANGTTYRAFVQITETGALVSPWGYSTFTLQFDAPAQPTLTVVAQGASTEGASSYYPASGTIPGVIVTVQGHDNLLSAADSNFETGLGATTATANCTVAQSNAEALNGSYSMAITATAAGNMSATSGEYAL